MRFLVVLLVALTSAAPTTAQTADVGARLGLLERKIAKLTAHTSNTVGAMIPFGMAAAIGAGLNSQFGSPDAMLAALQGMSPDDALKFAQMIGLDLSALGLGRRS